MPVICNVDNCGKQAVLKRPKTGDPMCKECFYFAFETEIHVTIIKGELFKKGDKVAIGASGGKDSTVLAYVLKLLNERYDYGLDLYLLSIDEGITGYRDDSLETVKQNRDDYQLPLKVLSYKDLYGWTMDEIVAQIGRKNNCTFCGVFRRQALDRGAALIGADMIVTGHNADDIAETIIMNVLRGDLARLTRCTHIITEGEGTIPRCKPLKYAYEKEIVMYAHYKELVYFSTECSYSPNAYRGHTREYIKEVERVRPSCILDIIHSGETIKVKETVKFPARRKCTRCGFVASQEICKACVLLEGLNTGMPKLGIGKSNKAKRMMGLTVLDGSENKSKKKPSDGSKRKVKRENKKKARTCGGNCSSNCGSNVPESTLQDVDIGDSFLSMSEANLFDEESACGQAMDSSVPSSSKAVVHESDDDSSDHEPPIQIKEKKEMVVCKCPSRLRPNVNRSNRSNPSTIESNDAEDDSGSSSDEGFNISLFKYLLTRNDPKPALPTEEELKNLIAESKENSDDNVNKKPPSSSIAKKSEGLESQLKNFSDVEKTQSSSSTVEHCDDIAIKQLSLLTVKESEHQESQLADHSNDANQVSDQPIVIKANAKKVKPSLMLPEMMYKATNNLDF